MKRIIHCYSSFLFFFKEIASLAVNAFSLAINALQARAHFPDVSASIVYDVLHDPSYRRHWDRYVVAAEDVGIINPNNDLCYYASKFVRNSQLYVTENTRIV